MFSSSAGAVLEARPSTGRVFDPEITRLAFEACGQTFSDGSQTVPPLQCSNASRDVPALNAVMSRAVALREERFRELFSHMIESRRQTGLSSCLGAYEPGREDSTVKCLVKRGGLDPDQSELAHDAFAIENTIRGIAFVCERTAGNLNTSTSEPACPVAQLDSAVLLSVPRAKAGDRSDAQSEGAAGNSEKAPLEIVPRANGRPPRRSLDRELEECSRRFAAQDSLSVKEFCERAQSNGLEAFARDVSRTQSLISGHGFINILRSEAMRSLVLAHVETNGTLPQLGSDCSEFRGAIAELKRSDAFMRARARFQQSSSAAYQNELARHSRGIVALLAGRTSLQREQERLEAMYREGSCRHQESSLAKDRAKAYANCGYVNRELRQHRASIDSLETRIQSELMASPYLQAGLLEGGSIEEQASFARRFVAGDSRAAMADARQIISQKNRELYSSICAMPNLLQTVVDGAAVASPGIRRLKAVAGVGATEARDVPHWMSLIQNRRLVRKVLDDFPEYANVYLCLRRIQEEEERALGLLSIFVDMGCVVGTVISAGALGPACALYGAARTVGDMASRYSEMRTILDCQAGSAGSLCGSEEALDALSRANVSLGEFLQVALDVGNMDLFRSLRNLRRAVVSSGSTSAIAEARDLLGDVSSIRSGSRTLRASEVDQIAARIQRRASELRELRVGQARYIESARRAGLNDSMIDDVLRRLQSCGGRR